MKSVNIKNRKKEHLSSILDNDVNYLETFTGLEKYRFIHNGLPEINFNKIDTSIKFLDHTISQPLLITSMSGGESNGDKLNKDLAVVAEKEKIALGLGSIRPVLEDSSVIKNYAIVRELAPTIPIIANIGAVQLQGVLRGKKLSNILKNIGADALAVHLNPLQELLQPEGDSNFSGISKALELLHDIMPLPIIIKEVGFGLSADVIKRVKKIGINWIDVAGAGGTSWAKIEGKRITNPLRKKIAAEFFEWGIPTATSLKYANQVDGMKIIASGGIDTGLKYSKSIALGADLGGVAASFLRIWKENGVEGLTETIKIYKESLKISMCCTGCSDLKQFRGNPKIIMEY